MLGLKNSCLNKLNILLCFGLVLMYVNVIANNNINVDLKDIYNDSIKAESNQVAINLKVKSLKPIVLQGNKGLSKKSKNNAK